MRRLMAIVALWCQSVARKGRIMKRPLAAATFLLASSSLVCAGSVPPEPCLAEEPYIQTAFEMYPVSRMVVFKGADIDRFRRDLVKRATLNNLSPPMLKLDFSKIGRIILFENYPRTVQGERLTVVIVAVWNTDGCLVWETSDYEEKVPRFK